MLIRDIITENTIDDLESDLSSILISIKANDLSSVDTNVLVQQLRKYGYSIDAKSILDVLENNPMIQVATTDTVQFANSSVASASGDKESKLQNKEKVESKAHKTALQRIKRK
jgi:hypothetical protein